MMARERRRYLKCGIASTSTNRWQLLRTSDADLGLRFENPLYRHAEVEVVLQSLCEESLQHWILKDR
jgi:hypothetical protein